MSITTIIQLALGLIQFVNWITQRISKAEWEASGHRKAMAEALVVLNTRVADAEAELTHAKKMTPEELRRELEE